MHYVAFNEQSALGRFAYFRIAMQYAFDRAYLVELLQGNAVASPVPMFPTAKDYPQNLAESLSYNLETCRVVLENAGIKDYDGDGRMEYMSGTPQKFTLTFVVTSDSTAKSGVVNRFAQDMDSLGINVRVMELTWDDYIKALEEGNFDMYYGEVKLRNNFDITELVQVHDPSHDDEEGYIRKDINYTGSTDTVVEQYVRAYLSAQDMTRASAFEQLCAYLTGNTGSLITIGFERQQVITHRGVARGIDPNAGNPLYNFQNWTVSLDETPLGAGKTDTPEETDAPEETEAPEETGAPEESEAPAGSGAPETDSPAGSAAPTATTAPDNA